MNNNTGAQEKKARGEIGLGLPHQRWVEEMARSSFWTSDGMDVCNRWVMLIICVSGNADVGILRQEIILGKPTRHHYESDTSKHIANLIYI